DLLVLFQDGRPVYSSWAHPATPVTAAGHRVPVNSASPRAAYAPLTQLADPFRTEPSVSAVRVTASFPECPGLSTSGGLPASGRAFVVALASSSNGPAASVAGPRSAAVAPYSPRGPPPVSSI